MQRQQIFAGLLQASKRFRIDRFQKGLQFAEHFFRSFNALDNAQPSERKRPG